MILTDEKPLDWFSFQDHALPLHVHSCVSEFDERGEVEADLIPSTFHSYTLRLTCSDFIDLAPFASCLTHKTREWFKLSERWNICVIPEKFFYASLWEDFWFPFQ